MKVETLQQLVLKEKKELDGNINGSKELVMSCSITKEIHLSIYMFDDSLA